ncbi:hypothetical protein [Acinetobacter sp. MD2]|nr:hypothetical protein [Acinetobacter sp. MD2]MEB3768010.1 hypothetical protein [Acinetobacter sp. MD2]
MMATSSKQALRIREQQEKTRIVRFIFLLVVLFMVSVSLYMLRHSQAI